MKNRKIIKKCLIIFFLIAAFLGAIYFIIPKNHLTQSNTIISFLEKPFIAITNNTANNDTNQSPSTIDSNPQLSSNNQFPNKTNINVPFTTQAPFANWDDLHNDGCEEASIISVIYYLNQKSLTPDLAEKEIQELANWQNQNFGGQFDLPVEKVAELVDKFYLRKSDLYYSDQVTITKIKELLSSNYPVIVPLAARVINNPYYRQPGPVYHMLVIRGYDDEKQQFITNDVGTKRGESYRYDYQAFYNAIHDMPAWEQNKSTLDIKPEMIFKGEKAMMVIK